MQDAKLERYGHVFVPSKILEMAGYGARATLPYVEHPYVWKLTGPTLGTMREGSDPAHARCICVHGRVGQSPRKVQLEPICTR